MLPTHRSRASQGWQDMSTDGPSKRLVPSFSFRSRTVRFIMLCGIAFVFVWWFMFSGPELPHPFRPPPFLPFDDETSSALPSTFGEHAEAIPEPSPVWEDRAQQVKQAFLHAYRGYEAYASPHDELLPLSNSSVDNFNGWGVTTVDSLDTMWLMGLQDDFMKGLTLVANISFIATDNYTRVPFFETTIRYLGGLLSAYALSQEPILLQRADDLGTALLPVFNTSSGLPLFSVNTLNGKTGQASGVSWQAGWLAEIASCQMEYKYLAHLTGRKAYYDVANTINMHLYDADTSRLHGLLPTQWNLTDGEPLDAHVAIGAMADSGYEYLLKQYLLTGKTESEMLELYLRTSSAILDNLVYLSPRRNLLYATDTFFSFPAVDPHGAPTVEAPKLSPTRKFEHLSCFLPGLFALGAKYLPDYPVAAPPWNISHAAHPDETDIMWKNKQLMLSPEERQRHAWAAEGITYACWMMYADQPTGLGPEEVTFIGAWEIEHDRLAAEALAAAQAAEVDDSPADAAKSKGAAQRVKVDPMKVNQTRMDEEFLWVNALAKWRSEGSKGTPPGLAQVEPVPATSKERDYHIWRTEYLLRPETLESIFLMWRTTKDIAWRERGWAIFQALEKEAKTASGYATIRKVQSDSPWQDNSMPSFFLAETLKYLYLLFKEDDLLPLDKFVLTTEAHPFPVFKWTEWQTEYFGIQTRT